MTPVDPQGATKRGPLPVMLTASEHFRRKWVRKIAVWGTFILLLTALALWLGPPVLESLKSWRGRKLVDFAHVQKKSGNKLEMRNLLLQAYGLAPRDEVVLRAMAEDYSDSPVEALRFLQQLANREGATSEDRLKLCRAAVDSRLISFAEREFQGLLSDPESKLNPVVAELCARYLTLRGEPGKALEWVSANTPAATSDAPPEVAGGIQAQEVPGHNANLNIIRAKLLLDSAPTEDENRTKTAAKISALLWAAIRDGEVTEQREAAVLLGRLYVTLPQVRETFDVAQTAALLSKLDEWSGDVRWDARLVASDLRIFLKPDSKQEILNGLIKAASDLGNPETQLELARWLNVRNEAGRAQGVAEANAAGDRKRDWFLIQLDAMAAQKKWAEIETALLSEKGVPIEEALARLFLWRCSRELGRPAAAVEELRNKALDAAKQSPPELDFFVAGYFEKLGEAAAAETIYARHVEDEAVSGPAFLGVIRCVSSDPARSADLKSILQKMLAKFPQVSEARNDLAYLNLLEGTKLNESIQSAEQLVNNSPRVLAYRTTMALAELVRGNFQQAEDIYRNVEPEWKNVRPGWIAVRAAVAGANGKGDKAKMLLEIIDKSALRSGERKLLEKYVTN